MQKKSAGILLYREHNQVSQLLLVHPGGPWWATKDLGVWSIPKGEFAHGENPLDAAKREVEEETGIKVEGPFIELTPVKLPGGKLVYALAAKGEVDPANISCNEFEIEWPPKSGKKQSFPEIDKAAWFSAREAKNKINGGQVPLIEEWEQKIAIRQ